MAKTADVKVSGTAPVTGMVELKEGENFIKGPPPGSSIANVDYTFEQLGDLMQFQPTTEKEVSEGSGEWMTVLADYVSGAKGQPLFKGQVRRLSNFVTDYAVNDDTKAAVLRLIQLGAIRKSLREEIAAGVAHITPESESPEVRAERAKRMIAEDRLAALERQMSVAPSVTTDVPVDQTVVTTETAPPKDEDEWGESDEKKEAAK